MKRHLAKILLFITIIAVIGAACYAKSTEVMAIVKDNLTTELTNKFGSVISVGSLELNGYKAITLHDINIYDKENKLLVQGDKITVAYNAMSLLTGNTANNAISNIDITNPTIYLEQKEDGRWNIEDAFKQNNSADNSFGAKVNIDNGTVHIKANNGEWQLDQVAGGLNFKDNPTFSIKLDGKYKDSTIKAIGIISPKTKSCVTFYADNIDVAEYQGLCPQDNISLIGGSIQDIELTVVKDKDAYDWAGECYLNKTDIDLANIPVRAATGRVTFSKQNVYLFTTANVFDQNIKVQGEIKTNNGQPILNLEVSSKGFDLQAINQDIPVSGQAAFKAAVRGSASNPIVTGDISLADGQIAGYAASNAKANIYIADKKITINNFSASMLGGNIIADGSFTPNSKEYQGYLKGEQLNTSLFAQLIPNMEGYSDLEVSVDGIGNLQNANIYGNIAMGQGKLADVQFDSLHVGFSKVGQVINIDYANIGYGEGLITTRGNIINNNINLTLYGDNLPLNALSQHITGLNIAGNIAFSGQVGGSLSAPEFTVSFTAKQGQVYYQPFTNAQGNIKITPQAVTLDNVELVDGVTSHKINGNISLVADREMNIKVSSKNARAENIVKLIMPGEDLTGNVDNELLLTGSLDNFNAEGKIVLTDGSFRKRLVAKAQGEYKRVNGVTTLDNFIINSLSSEIKLSGAILPDNSLNLDINAQDIDVSKVNFGVAYPIEGKANFVGKLTGAPDNPVFNGELKAGSLSLNNQQITDVKANINIQGNNIDIPNAEFTQSQGKYSIMGGIDINTKEIYGTIDVINADVNPIMEALQVKNFDFNGLLNGHISFNGTTVKPNIWLTGNLKDGKIKEYTLENATIDIALENNILKINEFSAQQHNGFIIAKGTADLGGELNLEVGGRDIDAGLLKVLFNKNIEASGNLNFNSQITGTKADPHAAISMEITKGNIGSASYDRLYGLLILDKESIHVNQILLVKGPYRASAYGTIPMAALRGEDNDKDNVSNQMDLKLRLDNADLSILPMLTEQVAWAKGPTKGELAITGTLGKPNLSGHILVNDGVVKLTAIDDPIQKVAIDIAFEGDTINVKTFEGYLGQGLYSLTGNAKLNGIDLEDYNFALMLNNLGLRSKYFTGPLNGKLVLNKNAKKPKLSGELLFENDIINIPVIPAAEDNNMDAALDVKVHFGKKVRFYNPYMYDIMAAGSLNFGGTLKDPDSSGKISAVRGTVSYLRTEFKVTEGSAEFTQVGSFLPVIKLAANTKLQQTVVNLKINGPANEMQFNLTSDPAMNQEQIISLLTLRSRYFEQNAGSQGLGRDELINMLDAGLQMRFISELEASFRNALGLDEFKLVRDTSTDIIKSNSSDKPSQGNADQTATINREVYNVEFGKYVSDKVYLSYTLGVDHRKNDFGVRYDLNRHVSLIGSIDDQNRTVFGMETRFKF